MKGHDLETCEWARDTLWKQGSLFIADGDDFNSFIVISHDCDIANTPKDEPSIEVIEFKRINKLDGNYTHAKNPRKLHLCLEPMDGNSQYIIEICAKDKQPIDKELLIEKKLTPSTAFYIKSGDKGLLKRWLGSRYDRQAFSEMFESYLSPIKKDIEKAVKDACNVSAIYFSLDEDATPIKLDILVIYGAEFLSDAENQAEELANNLRDIFEKQFYDNIKEVWSPIELIDCYSESESDITLDDIRRLKQWRLEHVSFKDSNIEHILPSEK